MKKVMKKVKPVLRDWGWLTVAEFGAAVVLLRWLPPAQVGAALAVGVSISVMVVAMTFVAAVCDRG